MGILQIFHSLSYLILSVISSHLILPCLVLSRPRENHKHCPSRASSHTMFVMVELILYRSKPGITWPHISNVISLYIGCVESTQASHLDGCGRQCHLWNLLAHRRNSPCGKRCCLTHPQSCRIFCHSHHDHDQFRRQSLCLRPDKPTIQGENKRSPVLQYKRATGYRIAGQQQPHASTADMFHGRHVELNRLVRL